MSRVRVKGQESNFCGQRSKVKCQKVKVQALGLRVRGLRSRVMVRVRVVRSLV